MFSASLEISGTSVGTQQAVEGIARIMVRAKAAPIANSHAGTTANSELSQQVKVAMRKVIGDIVETEPGQCGRDAAQECYRTIIAPRVYRASYMAFSTQIRIFQMI